MLGGTIVLQDIWDPATAARLIEAERVTYCMGATPFLNDLAHYEGITQSNVGSLRYFISGGAPIPAALVRTATAWIGCKVIAIWGMTEVSAVTTVLPDDPPEHACESDGIAMPHSEVRVADETGNELPCDQPGRLLTRGPTQFVGYFKRPQFYTVNAEGWLDTGDLARMEAWLPLTVVRSSIMKITLLVVEAIFPCISYLFTMAYQATSEFFIRNFRSLE